MAEELTAKDVIKAHARDELGIDMDDLSNPIQAAAASAFAFCVGAALPLLAGAFLANYITRLLVIVAVSTVGLLTFGITGEPAKVDWMSAAVILCRSVAAYAKPYHMQVLSLGVPAW